MNHKYTLQSFTIKRLLAMCSLTFCISMGVSAENVELDQNEPVASKPAASIIPKGFRFADFNPGLRKWGLKADLIVGFRLLEKNDTALWARLGSSYGSGHYYRLPSDGSMYNLADNPGVPGYADTSTNFWRFNLNWGFGIMQGLHFDPVKDRDDLNLLLSYRGTWDANTIDSTTGALLTQSSIPEKNGSTINSFQLDLQYKTVTIQKITKVPEGLRLDGSIEYAPQGISTPQSITFLQYNADIRGFLPLYQSTTENNWNLFSMYLAAHASFDILQGLGTDARTGIPVSISERFGGYSYEDGLGGMMRGLGDGYNDGIFKAVGNLELRANLPAMLHRDLLLGLVAYLDAGAWANPPGLSLQDVHNAGFVMGAGFGIFGDFFDRGYLAIYTNFIFNQTNYKGSHWEPYSIEFGLHF